MYGKSYHHAPNHTDKRPCVYLAVHSSGTIFIFHSFQEIVITYNDSGYRRKGNPQNIQPGGEVISQAHGSHDSRKYTCNNYNFML